MTLGAGAAAAEPTELVRRGALQQALVLLKRRRLAPEVHRLVRLGLHRWAQEVVLAA